jgi:hypothetical protein
VADCSGHGRGSGLDLSLESGSSALDTPYGIIGQGLNDEWGQLSLQVVGSILELASGDAVM